MKEYLDVFFGGVLDVYSPVNCDSSYGSLENSVQGIKVSVWAW